MHSKKNVGPRMDPWGTPALTGYSYRQDCYRPLQRREVRI